MAVFKALCWSFSLMHNFNSTQSHSFSQLSTHFVLLGMKHVSTKAINSHKYIHPGTEKLIKKTTHDATCRLDATNVTGALVIRTH